MEVRESQPQPLTFLTLSRPSDQKWNWVWGPQKSRPLRGAVVATSRWAEPALMRSPPCFLRRNSALWETPSPCNRSRARRPQSGRPWSRRERAALRWERREQQRKAEGTLRRGVWGGSGARGPSTERQVLRYEGHRGRSGVPCSLGHSRLEGEGQPVTSV